GRSSVQGLITDQSGRGLPGVEVVLKQGARDVGLTLTSGDGIFRLIDIAPGEYTIALSREGLTSVEQSGLRVGASELVSVELKMNAGAGATMEKRIDPGPPTPYGNVVRPRPDPNAEVTPLAPDEKIYVPVPDRWNLNLPEWDRYGGGDYPYVVSKHWWNPYKTNRLKGD